MESSNDGFAIPFSVIIPEINSGGVMSNAGFMTLIPSGAVFLSPIPVTSSRTGAAMSRRGITLFARRPRWACHSCILVQLLQLAPPLKPEHPSFTAE